MTKALIYKIVNTLDGKVYVGSTINFKNRWKCHRSHLRAGTHHSRHLQFAWNKHGEASFMHEALEVCEEGLRALREQVWIDTLRSADPNHGYNGCPVAMSCARRAHSDETRRKISAAHKGRQKSAAHCARLSSGQRGRKTSEATRAKLSKALTGKKRTPEQIQKCTAARAGFKHSESAKAKMRAAAQGRPVSDETRAKLALAGSGRQWTAAQRLKMESLTHGPATPEKRRRISEAKGGRPFTCTSASGEQFHFNTLSEVVAIGLDSSNVHKCLIGKAKQTKGYRCEYQAPELSSQI